MSENEQKRPKKAERASTWDAPLDRRVRRTRRQILDATVELMKTRGIDGLTMDAVADAADVSRSTLYRHWPHLHELLVDGLQHLGDQVVAGADVQIDGDTFEQCVMNKALAIGQRLRDNEWRTLITTLGVAAEHNTEAADVYDRWVTISRSGVAEYVRGCTAIDVDPDWVSDLVLGPIYLNAVMLHQAMTDEQITTHVARTLAIVSAGTAAQQ